MYDISAKMASHPSAPTLFELLEADNNDHIVMNALIDVAEVERVLMFKDNKSCCAVLKDPSACPRTLKYGYTLDWYKFTPVPRYAARVMPPRTRAAIVKSGQSVEDGKK